MVQYVLGEIRYKYPVGWWLSTFLGIFDTVCKKIVGNSRKWPVNLQCPSCPLTCPEDFPQGAVPFPLEFFDEKKKKIGGL